MQGAPPPSPAEPEPYVGPEDRPARLAELRGLRRWLLVAAVWATAATAIAVIALLAADDAKQQGSAAGGRSERTAARIDDLERRLAGRLDELERRLDELPSSEDVSSLDSRLKRVEAANERAADDVKQLTSSVDDLETRLESLEEAPRDTTATTPEASP